MGRPRKGAGGMTIRAYCDEPGCPESAPMSVDAVAPKGWTARYRVADGKKYPEPLHTCPRCLDVERRGTRARRGR